MMGLFERRSSRDDHDDSRHRSNSPDRHHPAHDPHSTDATDSPGPSFASRMQASMHHLRMPSSRSDMSPYQAISHVASHFLPHSSSDSRASSAKTSSSSLQALHEDAIAADARSEHTYRSRLGRRASHQADTPASLHVPPSQPGQSSSPTDYPVYPNQSYSALQYQPPLRGRSSYPSNTDRSSSSFRIGGSSTPGLFSGRSARTSPSIGSDDSRPSSPHLLHPMHLQPPKETHTADIERNTETGNKRINDYEILEELGRGEHGKVKLGRHIYTNQRVAIKIVQRYSKRRRLGKLGDPEDKVKKEVAILKKARHPNVVSLLEVIDDPNLQKVYIVLEYVENGEIKWRKKGNNAIVQVDKLRMEREKQGIYDSPTLEEAQRMVREIQHQERLRELTREKYRAQAKSKKHPPIPAWSLEHGGLSDDETSESSLSRTVSQNLNLEDLSESANVPSIDQYLAAGERDNQYSFLSAFDGSMYGPYVADPCERRPSASSLFKFPPELEVACQSAEDDDLSYVPCLTIDEARNAFRDALLGLEYLHYQGIIHRDIKPANLLVTAQKEVKISDFGVSYLGRPISDDDEEHVSEKDAAELDDARGELSKTVGTPAFYAPELCYISEEYLDQGRAPKITAAIDIWSLGVTLYGMIFGRLPFVSDDEYGLFQSIGKDEPFIPRKRLVPVEYDTPSDPDLIPSSKRRDDELRYEDIDPDLRDLLMRLLTKDPQQRISIKAIKEHPWVVKGLPKDRNLWLQETDQSKVHRIEVSNEEVTSAVSKVPFVDRVKNSVARLSSYIVNRRDSRRDGRRRTPSATGLNTDSSRDFREGRRASLRGDEDTHRIGRSSREPEHPLSHSVSVSPEGAHMIPSGYLPRRGSESLGHAPRGQGLLRRHGSARAASVLSSADSTKTIRAPVSDDARAPSPPRSHPDSTSLPSNSYRSGGFFRASSQRRGSDVSEGEVSPLAGNHLPDGDAQYDSTVYSPHPQRASRSQLFSTDRASSARPIPPGSLWRAHGEHMTPDEDNGSRPTSPGHSGDDLHFEQQASSFDPHHNSSSSDVSPRDSFHCFQNPGMTRSPPSATTISSTSVDDGMSPSTSHPSIPSVISGASSLCSDGFRTFAVEQRPKEMDESVPSMLRTVDTVTVKGSRREQETDEHDESEDEGIVFGKRR